MMVEWGGEIAKANAERLRRDHEASMKRVKGERCQAVTLVGYRRCRKPASWPRLVADRERYVCGNHYDADLFYDSPEYLSSPGYIVRQVQRTTTVPGTMTFTVLERKS